MKLRHQIAILLGFLIACQLATTALLMLSLAKVDETARKEMAAKKVVGLCDETAFLIARAISDFAVPSIAVAHDREREKLLASTIAEKIHQLRELVKDNDQVSKSADRLEHDATRMFTFMEDLSHAFDIREGKFFFSQFFELNEYVESSKVLLDRIQEDESGVIKIYSQEAQEFQPAAIRARSDLRSWIIAAVSLNVLLILALALVVNRNTLVRLQALMKNMQAFSRGKQAFDRLAGSDELAELDQAFKNMADERNRLEETRQSMLAMVTHDLKSPVTSISLGMELILDVHKPILPEEVGRTLERMYSESQRLARLINTLLDVEKIESAKLEVNISEHDCAAIVQPALAAVAALTESKQIDLKLEGIYDPEIILACDMDRTIQVVVNLLTNAIKFSPNKSVITIRVAATGENVARLEVIDAGPGVPPDKVNSLFTKYHQLDQPSEIRRQGSGLGLYICKELITAQGGRIGYASPENGGGCFWFELPVRQ